jgi:hypothetical protein
MGWKAVLDGVRRPEDTGRNRCRPCTILDVGITIGYGRQYQSGCQESGAIPSRRTSAM